MLNSPHFSFFTSLALLASPFHPRLLLILLSVSEVALSSEMATQIQSRKFQNKVNIWSQADSDCRNIRVPQPEGQP
jgi:hypothetical protein